MNPVFGRVPVELEQLRDQVADHLLGWAENAQESAASRRNALGGLVALLDALTDGRRENLSQRLLAVAHDPGVHPADTAERASQHPLSHWRVDLGGDHLVAHCLSAAAQAATSRTQAEQVGEYLAQVLPAVAVDDDDETHLLGQAVYALHSLQPQPLARFARHRAWPIRLAAVQSWAEQEDPDPPGSSMPDLTTDPHPHIRLQFARALVRFQQRGHQHHTELLTRLRSDPSAQVRRAARA